MKISIFDEAALEKEREITLRLFKKCGKVVVGVVSDEGEIVDCGALIEFHHDMTFTRVLYVSTELGLPLDIKKRLIEETND